MSTAKTNFYKLELNYDGHLYCGWQIQPDMKTVQGELNKALREILKTDFKTIGAGRTDTGVHALGQIVKLTTESEIAPDALKKGLNSLLPRDIRISEISHTSESFIPTSDAISKTYFYLFSNEEKESAFQKNYMPNISYQLDFDAMVEACALFIGVHDFEDFQCKGSDVATSRREIFKCELTGPHFDTLNGVFPSYYKLEVSGNGFLKQMVRLMMGTIWNIGRNKIGLEELRTSLTSPQKVRLGAVAPASGLYKSQVVYHDSH